MMDTPEAKIARARVAMLLRQPFFGSLVTSLKLEVDEGDGASATTDGITLFVSPEWVEEIDQVELQAVLLELTAHTALKHPFRRGLRDPQRWNAACDQAVFHMLLRGGEELRGNARPLPQFAGLTAEAIYEQLPTQPGRQSSSSRGPGQQPLGKSCANPSVPARTPGAGDVVDPPPDVDRATEEQNLDRRIRRAEKAAKNRGKLPAALEREIHEILRPRRDWKAELINWMQQAAPSDYTWTRPSKRFLPLGLFLPSMRVEALGTIVFAIDTSGSIGQADLNVAADEATQLCNQLEPEAVHVVYCDAKVQRVQTFERGEPLRFEAKGGGGTNFRPVFDWIATLPDPPVGLVFFTDADGAFPATPPEYPVLWLISGTRTAPFGECVRVD